ncbi:Cysteine and histidine-rich protein 1 [Bonamia ostreae]|uniref:Cysteine and histidine-rich protein 1 n=1 Tax=Bonamia ostreae TaxID=126728 RepID=A0ABV2AL02_9EUKA
MTRNKRVKIFKEKKSPLSLQESLKKDELYCNVCRDFPKSKEIFQCKNSHLLCSFCHSRILEKDPSTCPVCRIKLSRENPCRSRLAESIISKMVVHCPNTLCAEKLYNEDLRRHERELCPFRNARCKFFSIGCEWRGIAKKKRKHEKSCAIRSLSADNILKFCRERSAIREAAERKRIAVLEKERRLVAALSQRSRCVVVRELKMYSSGNRRVSGKLCKVFVSRRFNVFECVFYLEVVVAVGDNLNEQVVVTPTVVTNASSNVPGNNNISSVVGNNGVANNNNISSVAVGDNKNRTLIAATNNIETKGETINFFISKTTNLRFLQRKFCCYKAKFVFDKANFVFSKQILLLQTKFC